MGGDDGFVVVVVVDGVVVVVDDDDDDDDDVVVIGNDGVVVGSCVVNGDNLDCAMTSLGWKSLCCCGNVKKGIEAVFTTNGLSNSEIDPSDGSCWQ